MKTLMLSSGYETIHDPVGVGNLRFGYLSKSAGARLQKARIPRVQLGNRRVFKRTSVRCLSPKDGGAIRRNSPIPKLSHGLAGHGDFRSRSTVIRNDGRVGRNAAVQQVSLGRRTECDAQRYRALPSAVFSGRLNPQSETQPAGICTPLNSRRSEAAPSVRGFFYGRAFGAVERRAVPRGGSANSVRPATRDLHPSGRVYSISRRCPI